jgi:Right handed beta helix region/Periplasmic copper-binding protein (NosD)
MKHARACAIRSVLLAVFFLWLSPAGAAPDAKQRTCGSRPGHTLQHFLDELKPGDTLIVSGTCNENVVIGEGRRNITIDGRGTATINGSGNPNAPAVRIRGRGITIKGFTIIGGRHGVQFIRGGTGTVDGNLIRNATAHGVGVHNNSSAEIVDNTIENNGANGICVCEHSVADIGFRGDFSTQGSPNVVRNNAGNGIVVTDASYAEIESNSIYGNTGTGVAVDNGSSAKIGFQSGVSGTFAGANTIESNGNRGILVARSSSARIVENIIRNNTGDGVGVVRAAQADIAANAIDGNTGDGIFINQNSGINLGNDSGSTPQDQPNDTTTNNAGFGVRCLNNSSADGRQGTLNGNSGPQSFAASCVNSLIP